MTDFLKKVEEGSKGLNKGIYGGFPRFDKYICNTQKGWVYTVVGNSGSGKSAFILYHQILIPWISGVRNVKWFFWSLEMSEPQVISRLVSFFMKKKYGITLSSTNVLSRGDMLITKENKRLVTEIYLEEIEPLLKNLTIITDRRDSNPTGIRNFMTNYAKENGTFHTVPYTVDIGGKKMQKEKIVGYTPNDPNEHVQVIIDHCILMKREKNYSLKQNIDKWVDEYSRDFANLCEYSIINIAQLNRAISDHNRIKDDGADLMPQTSDIKETGSFEQSSDVVIGIFNPNAYKKIKRHGPYNLSDWRGMYRCLRLMKARDLPFPKTVPVLLYGDSSMWEELPKTTDLTAINKIKATII